MIAEAMILAKRFWLLRQCTNVLTNKAIKKPQIVNAPNVNPNISFKNTIKFHLLVLVPISELRQRLGPTFYR